MTTVIEVDIATGQAATRPATPAEIAGNPLPAPAVPVLVSRFQAKTALLQAGLLAAVEAAMAQASPVAQLAWADAVEFRRDSPTVAGMAATLNLTGAQLDALFMAAAQIEA
jgi:hypothetical protein